HLAYLASGCGAEIVHSSMEVSPRAGRICAGVAMLTVLLSSHNGGDDLKRMLDGLMGCRAPRGGWRLVAVDNASTDGTGEILRSYADRLPLTILYEPQPGKNRALNRAL